jgi:hypothetical protein
MFLRCKAKAVTRKSVKFKNKKLMAESRLGIFLESE